MKLLRHLSYLVLLFCVVSCGGGSSLSREDGTTGEDGDTSTSEEITLTVSLSHNAISDINPAIISATLLDDSTPLVGKLITFTTTLGELSPSLGTAITNSSGIASITLNAGNIQGAGTVTADFEGISDDVAFSTAGDGQTGSSSTTKTISLTSSNVHVTGQDPIVITASVTNGEEPVENEVVTFTLSQGYGSFLPSSGTALTNNLGVAEIQLTAGTIRGADTVTASLLDGTNNTLGYSTQGDDISVGEDINIIVTLNDEEGNPTETITSTKPGEIVATVNGIFAPVIVNFTSEKGVIPIATAITDDNNQARAIIQAGTELGAGEITATIKTGETGTGFVIVGATNLKMGSGDPFQDKAAQLSLSNISAGGTATVSVNIIDDEGNPFNEPVNVTFSSNCVINETASIDSPVISVNGLASSTYLAKGCNGSDIININADAGGISLSASTTIEVSKADIGSIEFIEVSDPIIAIEGVADSVRPASSKVTFKVLDKDKNPVSSQLVDFELISTNAEFTLNQTSATTNAEGIVEVVVKSGTVPGSVQVKASVNGEPLISTGSTNLKASTGIPDQDSFTVSADTLNVEGWDYIGTEVKISARLADASNNPPPPTVVYFTTEGGSIENNDFSCVTDSSGQCSVTWRTQNPKPEGNVLQHKIGDPYNWSDNPDVIHPAETSNSLGQKYGGRVTILATAIGEESFADLNGNGRFDLCEKDAFLGGTSKLCADDGSLLTSGPDIVYSGNDVGGRPFDLKEAFVDHNEDGLYHYAESGGEIGGDLEEYSDFNNNGDFDQKDGKYNGSLCSLSTAVPNTECSEIQRTDIRGQVVLIMSGSTAYFTVNSTYDSVAAFIDDDDDENTPEVANPNYNPNDSTIYIAGESSGSATVTIADLHNQPMPAGTTVSFSSTVGSIQGTSSYTWPNDNHNGGLSFSASVKGEDEPTNGNLIITVTTPNGTATAYLGVGIVIQ